MSTSNLFEWTSLLGGSNWDRGSALTTGSDGSIYIAGDARSDFDGQTNTGPGQDAFISKFSPDGTKEWTRFLGGFWGDVGKALATGIDGSIYISGHTQNHLDAVFHSDPRDWALPYDNLSYKYRNSPLSMTTDSGHNLKHDFDFFFWYQGP